MEVTKLDYNLNKVVVGIEYPGMVENVDKMLESLGGVDTVTEKLTINEGNKNLRLRFRPDDVFSKFAISEQHPVNGLLLKVKVRRYEDERPSQIQTHILARVERMLKFQNLCDYQYLPVVENEEGVKESIYDDVVPAKLETLDWLNKSVPLFIPPPYFSRYDKAQDYRFRRKPGGEETTIYNQAITQFRTRRHLPSLFVKFEQPIPTKPLDTEMNFDTSSKVTYDEEVAKLLEKLFQERPVWCRNALESKLREGKVDLATLKYILPRHAYYFTTGPWFKAWVRFGYDPRKDPDARRLQVLDFRLPAILASEMNVEPKRVYRKSHIGTSRQNLRVGNSEEHRFYEFHPGRFPPQRSMLYQYCDILIPEVEEILSIPVSADQKCTELNGWLPFGSSDKVRKILINYLTLLAKKTKKEEEEKEGKIKQLKGES